MKPPKLIAQLNDIRFHIGVVFKALKTARLSLDHAGEVISRVEIQEEPKLRLVVNNDPR